MKKIPSVFERDWDGDRSRVLDEPTEVAAWVFAGEGVPTEKHDGTAARLHDGALYKRYQVRPGKATPEDFEPTGEPDPETGKQVGWVPVNPNASADKYFLMGYSAYDRQERDTMRVYEGTYELVGPKVQGNKYNLEEHILVKHGSVILQDCERNFAGIKAFLEAHRIEGIVWHHPDGRMAKIKRRDFGLPW